MDVEDIRFLQQPAVAKPGDDDLDMDYDGLTVTAVVTDPESGYVMVRLVGGFGRAVDPTTGREVVYLPHDGPCSRSVEFHLRVRNEVLFEEYAARFQVWRDTAVPIRMCGAPDRMTAIVEDNSSYILIPRRKPKAMRPSR